MKLSLTFSHFLIVNKLSLSLSLSRARALSLSLSLSLGPTTDSGELRAYTRSPRLTVTNGQRRSTQARLHCRKYALTLGYVRNAMFGA